MACDCIDIKPIPLCADTLYVGKISDTNKDVVVSVIAHRGRDIVYYQGVTSGTAGEIEISIKALRDAGYVTTQELYTIEVVVSTIDQTPKQITLPDNTTVASCLNVELVDSEYTGTINKVNAVKK